MTAVKHPFECNEMSRYRRFKYETLGESLNFKLTRLCQAFVEPIRHPRPSFSFSYHPYVVPSHSRWFDYKKISRIEQTAFPELTDPAFRRQYLRVRNRMVKLFRLCPTQEVTVSVLRHMWGGNFKFIERVHQFLSNWGLINFIGTFPGSPSPSPCDARLVSDFSQLIDATPLLDTAPAPPSPRPMDIPCTLCRSNCRDGHYATRKYPGIIICPQCFTHQYALEQLEASHVVFDFHTVPAPRAPQRPPADYDSEIRQLIDQFEQTKGDWTKTLPERPKMPNERPPPPPKSPLDSMVGFLRASLADGVAQDQATAREFDEQDVVSELLAFARGPAGTPPPARPPPVDWSGLEGELALLEDEVRATLARW
jgi:hypothetical protein